MHGNRPTGDLLLRQVAFIGAPSATPVTLWGGAPGGFDSLGFDGGTPSMDGLESFLAENAMVTPAHAD